jgi:serine/threonine protein kinase
VQRRSVAEVQESVSRVSQVSTRIEGALDDFVRKDLVELDRTTACFTRCMRLPHVTLPPEFSDWRYEARGGFSRIYSAIYRPTGKKVAVKHVENPTEARWQSFRREIAAHKAFSHPACLGLAMSEEIGPVVLLATPFMEHSDLHKALCLFWKETPLAMWPTMHTLSVFGIAFGMEHIHAKGYVHGDLKPANVFFDERFYPVIGDFGLTRLTGQEVQLPFGTPLYMAPEFYTDRDQDSQKIDVYSYAMLLYSLFCQYPGTMLNDGRGRVKSTGDLITRIHQGVRFQRVAGIPDSYWELITNGWSHNPTLRWNFKSIVNVLLSHVSEFMVKGCREDIVKSYIQEMTRLRPK